MSKNQYLYLFKVVLVGNSCVGKSSIVIRYADDQFSQVFLATIGVDFRFKSFVCNGQSVKLQIWDTAGQQKFRTITSSYYRGAHALMIVFDITDRQSYIDATNYWYQQIKNACPQQTQILLVGNKSDLNDQRKVTVEEINEFLEVNKIVKYIQTSAKTSQKIQEAFQTVARMLLDEEQKKHCKSNDKKVKNDEGKKILNNDKKYLTGYRQYCCQS